MLPLSLPYHQHSRSIACDCCDVTYPLRPRKVRVRQWVTGRIIPGMKIKLNMTRSESCKELDLHLFFSHASVRVFFICVIRNSFDGALLKRITCCTDTALSSPLVQMPTSWGLTQTAQEAKLHICSHGTQVCREQDFSLFHCLLHLLNDPLPG